MKKQFKITHFFNKPNYIVFNKKKQFKITYFFNKKKQTKIKTHGYNIKTNEWHCLTCGVSMGTDNPRQLCKKSYCDGYLSE